MSSPRTTSTPIDLLATLQGLDDDFILFTAKDRQALPSEEVVAAFEREIGFPLEAFYRAFVLEVGCAAAFAKESVWPRAKAYDVRPRWQFEYGIELFGLASTEVAPPLDARGQAEDLKDRGIQGRIAVASILGVSLLLTVDAQARYAWLDGKDQLEPTEGTFATIVAERVRELQTDKDRLVAEGIG